MKKLFLILTCVLMCGCDDQSVQRRRSDRALETATELIYTKDYRTNICYAMIYPQSNYGLMSAVQCTPEVEALINK